MGMGMGMGMGYGYGYGLWVMGYELAVIGPSLRSAMRRLSFVTPTSQLYTAWLVTTSDRGCACSQDSEVVSATACI